MDQQRVQRFFKQTDTVRLVGGGLMIVGLVWFWIGMSMASYYIPIVIIPVGLIMFLVASGRNVSEVEIRQGLAKQMADVGSDVAEDAALARLMLKSPAPWRGEAFLFDEQTAMARRGKDAKLLSDTYCATALYFTAEHCYIRGRRIRLGQEELVECQEKRPWTALVGATLRPYEARVTLTNRRGTAATAKGVILEIADGQGVVWSAAVPNDMDSETICEQINRLIAAAKKEDGMG